MKQGQLQVTIGDRSRGATCFWVACPESAVGEVAEKIKRVYQLDGALKGLLEFADAGTPVHPGSEAWDDARAAVGK